MIVHRKGFRPTRCGPNDFETISLEGARVKVAHRPSYEALATCARMHVPLFFSRKATIHAKPNDHFRDYLSFGSGNHVVLDNRVFKDKLFPPVLEASCEAFIAIMDVCARKNPRPELVNFDSIDCNIVCHPSSAFVLRLGRPSRDHLAREGYYFEQNPLYHGNFLEVTNPPDPPLLMTDMEYSGEVGIVRAVFDSPVRLTGEAFYRLIRQTEDGTVVHNLFIPNDKKQFLAKVNLSISVFSEYHRFIKAGSLFGLKMFI